jgi:hypothetical protein
LYYEGYEAMKEIEESKQNMSDNVPRPNQRAAEDEAGGDEEEYVVEVREGEEAIQLCGVGGP